MFIDTEVEIVDLKEMVHNASVKPNICKLSSLTDMHTLTLKVNVLETVQNPLT
jgi:hypothetical protein